MVHECNTVIEFVFATYVTWIINVLKVVLYLHSPVIPGTSSVMIFLLRSKIFYGTNGDILVQNITRSVSITIIDCLIFRPPLNPRVLSLAKHAW